MMRAEAEFFKGIEFVRISSLPDEQKQTIWHTINRDKIIKIMRDKSLLNDCILYPDYINWLESRKPAVPIHQEPKPAPASTFFKLAFR